MARSESRSTGYALDERVEDLVRRLRRIEGQVRGLERMVSEGQIEVHQLAQGCCPFLLGEVCHREVVQREVGNQPPSDFVFGDAAHGP